MNDSIYIPSEVNELIEERNRIWEQFDQANNTAQSFSRFEREIPNVQGKREPVAAPAPNLIPDHELGRVTQEVRGMVQQITQLQNDIRTTETQILSIEARARSMTMFLIFAGIAGTLGLVALLFLLIS
jgi:hypothetical protein